MFIILILIQSNLNSLVTLLQRYVSLFDLFISNFPLVHLLIYLVPLPLFQLFILLSPLLNLLLKTLIIVNINLITWNSLLISNHFGSILIRLQLNLSDSILLLLQQDLQFPYLKLIDLVLRLFCLHLLNSSFQLESQLLFLLILQLKIGYLLLKKSYLFIIGFQLVDLSSVLLDISICSS